MECLTIISRMALHSNLSQMTSSSHDETFWPTYMKNLLLQAVDEDVILPQMISPAIETTQFWPTYMKRLLSQAVDGNIAYLPPYIQETDKPGFLQFNILTTTPYNGPLIRVRYGYGTQCAMMHYLRCPHCEREVASLHQPFNSNYIEDKNRFLRNPHGYHYMVCVHCFDQVEAAGIENVPQLELIG